MYHIKQYRKKYYPRFMRVSWGITEIDSGLTIVNHHDVLSIDKQTKDLRKYIFMLHGHQFDILSYIPVGKSDMKDIQSISSEDLRIRFDLLREKLNEQKTN